MTTKFPAFAMKNYLNLEGTQVEQINPDYDVHFGTNNSGLVNVYAKVVIKN